MADTRKVYRKMLCGFPGLVVPPESFSMAGFAGQCFSQIKYLSEFTSRFFTEDKQLTLFFSSSFLGILNTLFFSASPAKYGDRNISRALNAREKNIWISWSAIYKKTHLNAPKTLIIHKNEHSVKRTSSRTPSFYTRPT